MSEPSHYLRDLNGKEISKNGVQVLPRRNELNFIEGPGTTLSIVDNATSKRTDVTITSGASASTAAYVAPVRVATAVALPAYTRTGNVLTANANGALPSIDGVALIVGDRLLHQHGASAVDNGIFTVTSLGSGGSQWVLTRATDYDSDAEVVASGVVGVQEGTAYGNRLRILTTNAPIVVNTTALTYGDVGTGPAGSETGQIQTWDHVAGSWIAGRTIQRAGVGVTALNGLTLFNPDTPSAGNMKYAPAFVFHSQGRETGGTQREAYARLQGQVLEGATLTPRFGIALDTAADGTLPDAAATTFYYFFSPTTLELLDTGAGIQLGGFDTLRRVGTEIVFGSTSYTTVKYDAATQHALLVGSATEYLFSATAFDAQSNNIVTTGLVDTANLRATGTFSHGSSVAGTGSYRVGETWSLVGLRSASDAGLLSWAAASGLITLGANDADVDVIDLSTGTSGLVQVKIAGTSEAVFSATSLDIQSNDLVTTGLVDAGSMRSAATVDFGLSDALGGGATATLGTIGGTGPTAAAQSKWLEIKIGGTTHWVPAWV